MKRLHHIVKAIGKSPQYGQIDQHWVEPAPFPQGKHGYPTRIAYMVVLRDRTLRYTGKPTRQATSILYDAMRRRDCVSGLVLEFDRKNLVAEYSWQGRSPGITLMTRGNMALLHVYHPFDYEGSTVVIPYFLGKFYIKRLTLGRQKYVYYSPFERLKIKTQIDPFRLWIAAQRRLPVQPKEAPQKPDLKNYYQPGVLRWAIDPPPFFDPGPREDMP